MRRQFRRAAALLVLAVFFFPGIAGWLYFFHNASGSNWLSAVVSHVDSGGRQGLCPLLLVGMVILAGLCWLASNSTLGRRRGLAAVGFALAGLTLLSTLLSSNFWGSLVIWLCWLSTILVALLAAELAAEASLSVWSWLIVLAPALVLPAGYSSFLLGTGATWRMQGSFFLPGPLASYLVLLLPPLIVGYLEPDLAPVEDVLRGLVLMGVGGALVLALSRAALFIGATSVVATLLARSTTGRRIWPAVAVAGAVLGAGLWLGRGTLGGAWLMLLAGLAWLAASAVAVCLNPDRMRVAIKLIVLGIATFGWLVILRPRPGWLESRALGRARHLAQDDASTRARFDFWSAALRMAGDHPWLGVGPGNFGRFYPRYQKSCLAYSISVHNSALELAADAGYPALVLALGLAGCGLWEGLREPGPEPGRLLRRSCLLGVGAFLVLGLVDTSWEFPALWTTAAVLAGVGWPRPDSEVRLHGLVRGLAGIGLVACLVVTARAGAAEVPLLQANRARGAGHVARAADYYRRAAARLEGWPAPQESLVELELQQNVHSAAQKAALSALARSILRLDPESAYATSLAGRVHLVTGDLTGAVHLFKQALQLDRYNYPVFYLWLARAYGQKGQGRLAREVLEQAVARYPLAKLGSVYDFRRRELVEQLAKVYASLGEMYGPLREPTLAAQCFHTALRLDPRNRSALLGLGVTLLGQRHYRQAQAPLRRLLRLDPRSPAARSLLDQARSVKGRALP